MREFPTVLAPQKPAQTAPPPDFGRESYYYNLYREDPARARRALLNTFENLGRRIKETARVLRCSRNTVRAVLRRVRTMGRRDLRNPPSVPRGEIRVRQRRAPTPLMAIPLALISGQLTNRQRRSVGAVFMRAAAAPAE